LAYLKKTKFSGLVALAQCLAPSGRRLAHRHVLNAAWRALPQVLNPLHEGAFMLPVVQTHELTKHFKHPLFIW
jgi:hypothetical protein